MGKYNRILLKETSYIAYVSLMLSLVLQTVFLMLGKWDYRVLLGNILSVVAMVLNFFFMGLSVEKALSLGKEKTKQIMWASQSIRNILLFAILAIGTALPIFNTSSVVIGVFFPRIALALRPFLLRLKERDAA